MKESRGTTTSLPRLLLPLLLLLLAPVLVSAQGGGRGGGGSSGGGSTSTSTTYIAGSSSSSCADPTCEQVTTQSGCLGSVCRKCAWHTKAGTCFDIGSPPTFRCWDQVVDADTQVGKTAASCSSVIRCGPFSGSFFIVACIQYIVMVGALVYRLSCRLDWRIGMKCCTDIRWLFLLPLFVLPLIFFVGVGVIYGMGACSVASVFMPIMFVLACVTCFSSFRELPNSWFRVPLARRAVRSYLNGGSPAPSYRESCCAGPFAGCCVVSHPQNASAAGFDKAWFAENAQWECSYTSSFPGHNHGQFSTTLKSLKFDQEKGLLWAEGKDEWGNFHWDGGFNPSNGRVAFIKWYEKENPVLYQGECAAGEGVVRGKWHLIPTWRAESGSFELKPAKVEPTHDRAQAASTDEQSNLLQHG